MPVIVAQCIEASRLRTIRVIDQHINGSVETDRFLDEFGDLVSAR